MCVPMPSQPSTTQTLLGTVKTPQHVVLAVALAAFFFFNDTATTEIYTLSLHDALPIPVLLYVPFDVPDEQATIAFLAARERPMDGAEQAAHANGRLQPGWMVIAEIVRRINHIRYAWPVGRIRLQKIAYFATMAGVPSGFQYVEGSYGPFTPDLGPALGRLINNGVIVERPIGRMLAVRPG